MLQQFAMLDKAFKRLGEKDGDSPPFTYTLFIKDAQPPTMFPFLATTLFCTLMNAICSTHLIVLFSTAVISKKTKGILSFVCVFCKILEVFSGYVVCSATSLKL